MVYDKGLSFVSYGRTRGPEAKSALPELTSMLDDHAPEVHLLAAFAIGKIGPPATPVAADFKFVTGAYPNQLNNIALSFNDRASSAYDAWSW